MNAHELTNRSRIRVRSAGLISPITQRPVFRIEDETGRTLRRISSARTIGEALAHYWRGTGCNAKLAPTMPELPFDATLRRRIDRARSARGRGAVERESMLTHELPLPELDIDAVPAVVPDEAEQEQAAPARRPAPAGKRREPRPAPPTGDLFGTSEPDVPSAAVETVLPEPETTPEPVPEVAAEPEAVAGPEPEAIPEPDAVSEPEPDVRGPFHLDPDAVLLQQVDHRNLRPTDRSDSYLYHITNRAEATTALQSGLVVSAHDPVILTERQGVAYWLSVLAEDFDVILDGPADFVVLRMRRLAVEALLEPDPDASRSAGCACYLLTGGAASSG